MASGRGLARRAAVITAAAAPARPAPVTRTTTSPERRSRKLAFTSASRPPSMWVRLTCSRGWRASSRRKSSA